MGIKPILGTADARGLVMYVLLCSTKSTQKIITLLPILAEAVKRVQNFDAAAATAQERAKKLVQSSLCKVLSGTELVQGFVRERTRRASSGVQNHGLVRQLKVAHRYILPSVASIRMGKNIMCSG